MDMAKDTSLIDRVVIVTGGSRGLGKEMTLALLEAGARVAVVGLNDSAHLAQAIKEGEAVAGAGRVIPLVADLRREADCARIADETIRAFGTIHVLFNNAGVGLQALEDASGKQRPRFWETSVEGWNLLVDTDVHGVFLMA